MRDLKQKQQGLMSHINKSLNQNKMITKHLVEIAQKKTFKQVKIIKLLLNLI